MNTPENSPNMDQTALRISQISKDTAEQIVNALAVAKQMGMLNSQEDLILLVTNGIEVAFEEFLNGSTDAA